MTLRPLLLAAVLLAQAAPAVGDDVAPVFASDPHRNELGFFDIHICNWPQWPTFAKALFSTTHFKDIRTMEVFAADGSKLTDLSLERFKSVQKKGKPEKRVFMADVDVPAGSKDGWYYIVVKTHDGKEFRARDYLVVNRIARPTGFAPADGSENIPMPTELSWDPVPGAAHYKIFLTDEFEGVEILESALVQKPRVELKPGLLKPGGYYTWRIHARDVNENIILGDFNSGSISQKVSFSVADR